MLIGALTWRDVHNGPPPTLVVPVGSVEQHGPHLPLTTDLRVAERVAALVEDADPGLVLAPALAYGAAGEHEGFAGTVSIGHEGLKLLLVELGRSACRWAARVVFVNGHGGNVATLVEACALLRYEGRDVGWVPCAVRGDAHAGRTETSVMLALAPDAVRGEREPGA
ncbi:mycofactocin biosynthesis peptidyl-dipeptidase MftE, partial [Pseudonocardia pini]|uniref:mycofactocin biosynthesis peptidyl-dipeptidase MftE n=1 Tax=Pseudonocardia pini TaxID=2758030 RepID=UPI0015F035BE